MFTALDVVNGASASTCPAVVPSPGRPDHPRAGDQRSLTVEIVEPLRRFHVTYDLALEDGTTRTVVAHLADAVGMLALNFRSRDRSRAYQDITVSCDFSLPDEDLRGAGVLEIGTRLHGPGVADLIWSTSVRVIRWAAGA